MISLIEGTLKIFVLLVFRKDRIKYLGVKRTLCLWQSCRVNMASHPFINEVAKPYTFICCFL